MKHWKITLILLVALLLLSLSACGEKPNETTAPSGTGPSDSTTVYWDPIPDLTGEWYVDNGVYVGAGYNGSLVGQQLYRINEDGALSLLDIFTKEESLICAKEGCSHRKAFCDAYYGYQSSYLDGYLYRKNHNTLVRCRLDGTERTELLTMGELDPGDRHYTFLWPEAFQVTENAIYYTIHGKHQVNMGNFNFETKTIYILVRFDMESGEQVVIGEFDDKAISIVAARDEQVLITLEDLLPEDMMDLEDSEYDQIVNKAPVLLQVWDAEYGFFVTVKDGTRESFAPWGIEDGKILYQNGQDLTNHSYDPVTGTDTVMEGYGDRPIFGGKYVIVYDYESNKSDLVLAETGEKVHNDFGDLSMGICAHDDEGFIFEAEKIVYPEGQDWGEYVARTTYYVRFADMEDGLHDYDCILLDHWEREE